MPTHYDVLGIPAGASDEQVRHAYRRLARTDHPDAGGDAARFRRITEAYDVLSQPDRRAAYDRSLGPARTPTPPVAERPRARRGMVVALVAASVVGGAVWVVSSTRSPTVGDDCLVGIWRREAFEVGFRGVLDGREVAAPIRGGAGAVLAVTGDGKAVTDYAGAAPLAGVTPAHRIEGTYAGSATERWQAAGGRLRRRSTDTSGLGFVATINGRATDRPVAPALVDRADPYTCTPAALEVGAHRYTRA